MAAGSCCEASSADVRMQLREACRCPKKHRPDPKIQRSQMNMHRDVVPRLLMPTFALRAILAALLLSIGDVVLAQPTAAPSMAEDQRILPYVEPGQLVNIGGGRINLHCTVAGGPTVILMAGLFSWSVVWYKTQPVIAQKTR